MSQNLWVLSNYLKENLADFPHLMGLMDFPHLMCLMGFLIFTTPRHKIKTVIPIIEIPTPDKAVNAPCSRKVYAKYKLRHKIKTVIPLIEIPTPDKAENAPCSRKVYAKYKLAFNNSINLLQFLTCRSSR